MNSNFRSFWLLWIVLQNNPYQGQRTRQGRDCTTRKKKKHTVKNLYTSNQDGLIIYKSKHKQKGRKHDYRIYKKNHPDIPKDVMGMCDLGFFRVEKDYSQQKSSLPIKKEKGCALTAEEKEYNRNHSRKRIVIEHAICRIKKLQDNEGYL